jgi:hypothetical protein
MTTVLNFHTALSDRPVTLDLFDSESGLVNGKTVTITKDDFGVYLTTSTGLTGALVAVEDTKHWYLYALPTTGGFVAVVHKSDVQRIANQVAVPISAEVQLVGLKAAAQAYLDVATFPEWAGKSCRLCDGDQIHTATCPYGIAEAALIVALAQE